MSPTPKRSLRSNNVASTDNTPKAKSFSSDDVKQMLDACKVEIINTMKCEIEKISLSLEDLKTRIKGIEDNLGKTNEKLLKHDDDIVSLKSNVLFLSQNLPNQIFDEIEQRNFRAKNVMISGLVEVDGPVSARQGHDLSEVKNLLSEIVEDFDEDDIKKCHRVGRPTQTKERLLRVTFSNSELKSNVLRYARKLKFSTSYRNIYINPDRTPMQQAEYKELRSQLLVRREKGEDVVIFKKNVVPRADVNLKNFR